MSLATIYFAPVDHPGARAGDEQPAYRAWADALLRELALTSDPDLAAAVARRSTSRIGRLEPEGVYGDPIMVDACTLALASDYLHLFLPLA